jgi:hypothetical protein
MDQSKYETARICVDKIKQARYLLEQVRAATWFSVEGSKGLSFFKKSTRTGVSKFEYGLEDTFKAMQDAAIEGLEKRIEGWSNKLENL